MFNNTMKELTQDFKQRVMVIINCVIELYRVITSSLLILFVPQKCVDHACSLKENFEWTYPFYNTTLTFNFLTLFAFMVMYYFELRREYLLIKYLDVNEKLPNDNETVGQVLEMLPQENKQSILKIDKWYSRSGYTAMLMFVVNSFLSGFCVYHFYLNNQTTMTLTTYILFVLLKFIGVWKVIHTPTNVFCSSYLHVNIQYNDLDSKFRNNKV
jgi:hypothetical protein